jgi:streptogramin lyase
MPGGARTVIRARPLAVLAAVLAAALLPLNASAAPNPYDTFTEYTSLPLTPAPFDLITGPDGNIWYTAPGSDLIAQMDPSTGSILKTFSQPGCAPTGITIGPGGRLFVACFNGNEILGLRTTGVITHYALPPRAAGAGPEFLTAGPDGFLWFTEVTTGYVAKLNVSTGSLWEYPLPYGSNADPRGITVGSDNNVWFTERFANQIGRITPLGVITEFYVPTANSQPYGITTGPDGNIYYTESAGNNIGEIFKDGCCLYRTNEMPIPTAGSGPRMIAVGPDGNLWFAERDSGKIGSMTLPVISFQDAMVPAGAGSHPLGVAIGPDGNLWFTEEVGSKIGKVGTRHNLVTIDKNSIGFGNVKPGATTSTLRVTITNHGPDPVLHMAADLAPCFVVGCAGAGVFQIAASTCQTVPLASGSSCYVDVSFAAGSTAGEAGQALNVTTSFNPPDAQLHVVHLSANVVSPACTSAAITTDLASPQKLGVSVTISATSAGCPDPNPRYKFSLIVGVPQVAIQTLQDYSASNNVVWNTAGFVPQTYQIQVSVKDAASTNYIDAYASSTYTLGLSTCTSTNISSDVASPQAGGTTINFMATSIGCPAPLYQWWLRDTAGNWSVVPGHDFAHSSSTLALNTTNLIEGTYQVGVWVKDRLSNYPYDAFAFVTYTLVVAGGHCSVPTLQPSIASPQATTSSITFTAGVAGCTNPQFRFYIRDLAGIWHIAQDFSSTATYNWTNTSTPVDTSEPGTYLIGLWAKGAGSANTYDDFYFLTFTLTRGAPCTVNIAASPGTGATAGTTVAWTATAANCGAGAIYRFWVAPPGGAFGIVQDYSTSNVFRWTQSVPGTYQVGVWVRQSSSTASYDNFALTTFTLTPTNPAQVCGSIGVTSGVASPQMVGASVTFTAAANGCGSPRYQWWIRDTSANWSIASDFAHSSATLVWNTAGQLPGTYLVGVWARQAGSTASYEAYSIATYSLTVPAHICSSAGISPNVVSPQNLGTTITFAASSLGCSSPDYRFLTAPPNSIFGEVQPFGVSNTFAWNTSGLTSGIYQVEVDTRQHGSTAGFEAVAIITFQLDVVGTPCTTLTVWPTRGGSVTDIMSQGPQPVGTSITWMASAAGCGSVEYRFRSQPGLNQSLGIVQGYGPSATFTWNTAGWPAGTYGVFVEARLLGSGSDFDVYAGAIYEVA